MTHGCGGPLCFYPTVLRLRARGAPGELRGGMLARALWRNGVISIEPVKREDDSMGQRDVMRRIWARCKPDEEREVLRSSNRHGWTAEQYARALLRDGLRKGWL